MNSNWNNSVVTFLETFASSELNLLGVQSFEMDLFLKPRETKSHGVDRGVNAQVIGAALDGDWWWWTASGGRGERPQVAELNVLRVDAPDGDAETWATHGALPGGGAASTAGGAGRWPRPW